MLDIAVIIPTKYKKEGTSLRTVLIGDSYVGKKIVLRWNKKDAASMRDVAKPVTIVTASVSILASIWS